MAEKKIIPCLDMKDGRVVKGVQFVNLRDAGDPVELAAFYEEQGADELVFLDIAATNEGRETMLDVVRKVAEQITIPFTVGGGIRTVEQMKAVIDAGADKVSIGTAAYDNPHLFKEGAEALGPDRIVAAIDAKFVDEAGTWRVVIHGGNTVTDKDVVEWAKEAAELGAGEILLTSMDRDGEKSGYDLEMTKAVVDAVDVPVIASGGAGTIDDFYAAFTKANAAGALAASVFHFKETSVKEVKAELKRRGIDLK
ncbi:imidazole glycerol phosphate synthase subunit HisF [Pueribacillus theae]|uniref:Imidazole glycerol phosphate synthase subunit HisF n=1 Tax=Pueribacillus theae TaxID=2171751 RepID=A0A2U1K5X2_9BACI|nr:imidazole glycerol phosphate synthase subunit HisF [Pueribacillus theae]PWA12594.1 imidazole glycerol phosphate synthase subunit HisF [Pueribacillus theae]